MTVLSILFGFLLLISSFATILFLLVRVVLNKVKDRPKKTLKKLLFYIPISFAIGLTIIIVGINKANTEINAESSSYNDINLDDDYEPEAEEEEDDYEYDTEELTEAEQEELDEQEIYDKKETMITDFVDKNFQFDTTVTDFELNDHLGTDEEGDYIALVYLDMPLALSVKKGYGWIDKYTNYLAAEIGQSDDEISELVIFWTMAGSENNVAKYTLTRNGDNFSFDSKWQNPNVTD